MVLDVLVDRDVPVAFARTDVMPRLLDKSDPLAKAPAVRPPIAVLELADTMHPLRLYDQRRAGANARIAARAPGPSEPTKPTHDDARARVGLRSEQALRRSRTPCT